MLYYLYVADVEAPFRITNHATIDYYDSPSYASSWRVQQTAHVLLRVGEDHTLRFAWDCREECLCLLTQFPLSAAVSDFSRARPLDEL